MSPNLPGRPLEVEESREPGLLVLTVRGEVDLHSSPRLRTALLKGLRRRSADAVVDLGGVEYMDSSGIASLVEALHAARTAGRRLILAGLQPRVREVFALARLDTIFEIAESAAQAREHLRETPDA